MWGRQAKKIGKITGTTCGAGKQRHLQHLAWVPWVDLKPGHHWLMLFIFCSLLYRWQSRSRWISLPRPRGPRHRWRAGRLMMAPWNQRHLYKRPCQDPGDILCHSLAEHKGSKGPGLFPRIVKMPLGSKPLLWYLLKLIWWTISIQTGKLWKFYTVKYV